MESASNTNDPLLTFERTLANQKVDAGSNVQVKVTPQNGNVTVSNVRLFINGNFVRQENVAPYEWGDQRDGLLQNIAAGSYTLEARATTSSGAEFLKSVEFVVE